MSRRSGTLAAVAAGAVLLPALLTLLASGSCSLVDLYDGVVDAAGDGSGGSSGVGTSATSSSTSGTGALDAGLDAPFPCLDGMVPITPGSDAGYCIDKYEVTNADYARFLAAEDAGSPADSGTCHWNTTYVPDASLDAGDDLPVLGVNWCDAFYYCQWAGKRLCGSTSGGPTAPGDIDGTKSQWFRACSHDDLRIYPYSINFDISACVDCDPDAGCHEDGGPPSQGPAPVGSKATCEGGYTGIFDMSGNAAEWEDGCDHSGYHLDDAGHHVSDSRYDTCYHRGGSFYGSKTTQGEACLGCKVGGVIVGGVLTPCVPAADTRSHKALDVGLRCCFDY